MLLLILLTSLSLCLVQSQHVSLPRVPRDAICRTSDLRLIKDYFEKTTIIRNEYTTEPNYCIAMNKYSDSANTSNSDPFIDLDTVIELYKTLDYVNSYKYVESEGPVTQDGFVSINDDEMLPLYEIADIRKKHLPCHNSHTGFGEDVDEQMSLMGRRNSDGRGHLLAHSLGGMSRALNVIPMAVNIYWHPHVETSTELGKPLADWRSNEYWIRKFLLHSYPNGRVLWKMAVQYDENVFVKPKQVRSYRPISFSLQYTAYTHQDDLTTEYYRSPNITFLNDNHYTCKSRVISCHDEDDVRLPPNCDVRMSKQNEVVIEDLGSYPRSNIWLAGFFYYLEGEHYKYTEMKDPEDGALLLEIIKVSKNSKNFDTLIALEKNIDKTYLHSFPFKINGRQFMYGHCIEDKTWVIRELISYGNGLGPVTDNNTWPETHLRGFSYTIKSKYYFYSQWANNSRWFIRELLPDGKMGEEKSSDNWSESYPVVFSYVVKNKRMLYGHNTESRRWFVRELLPGGKMGDELNSNYWLVGYKDSFILTLGRSPRPFIYALSTISPYRWFFRELLPNGKISIELKSGYENKSYPLVITGNYICLEDVKCGQGLNKYSQGKILNQWVLDFIYLK